MMQRRIHPRQFVRHIIQLIFLIGFAIGLVMIGVSDKGSIHSLCAYSTVCFGFGKAGIFTVAAGIFGLTILISLAILVITIFRGREFCAYVCPLGTVQEFIFKLRSKKSRMQQSLSYLYEYKFIKIKYIILILTTILSMVSAGYIYIRLCPIYAVSILSRLAIPGLLTLLLLIIIPGFFLHRFWCRFLCPYAAMMNIAQGMGTLFGIKRRKIFRNLERCVDCGICIACCPMNIDIAAEEYVHSWECIHCHLCSCKCPKSGTICCSKEE